MATNQDALDAIVDINEAFAEYGNSMTLNVIIVGVYNPDTGETTNTTSSSSLKCISIPANIKQIDNTNIFSGDIFFKFYYSGSINSSSTITYNSKTYRIMNINQIALQDTLILYTVQARA